MIHVLMFCDVDDLFFFLACFCIARRWVPGFFYSSLSIRFSSLFCDLISLHFDNDIFFGFFCHITIYLLLFQIFHRFTYQFL